MNKRLIISCLCCLIYSAFAVCISLYYEYSKNVLPCTLCKIQQLILIFILASSSLFLLIKKWCNLFLFLLRTAVCLCFIFSFAHLLVQINLVPDFCEVPKNIRKIEDFSAMLSRPQQCSISMTILGLPASGLNAFFALISFILLIFPEGKEKRPTSKIDNFAGYS